MSFLDRDPSFIRLGGTELPGIVFSIEGANRKYIWKKQKATGSSGASIIFEGADIAEGIKVSTWAPTLEMQQASVEWRKYIVPVKIGGKPPTFSIENVLFEFNGITRVSVAEIEQPKIGKDLNVTFVWTFVEYQPPAPAKTGPAGAAGYKGGALSGKGGDPAVASLQAQAKQAQADMKKAMAKS